ncbi:uncharacterized protein LOC121731875 [Aricia agestis]|uniref:uncharacterized protein LOC121731875 n=1 Tax=Aricia agestis TaxID=91739 RepID=UPI001C203762|nr:uncharacterized protein LOC121731875 [Aricia agestis]
MTGYLSKKYYAQIKNSTSQTGGGPLILKIDPVLEQVCAILGRGCTGVLGVPDCDAESGQEQTLPKIICTQNEHFEPAVEVPKVQTIVEPKLLETREETFCKSQPNIIEGIINIDENLTVEPKGDGAQEKQILINRTPLWSRRRPQIQNNNERSEATATVSYSIQNVYKKRETVEDLKEQLLREELEFKKKLYQLQIEAATREVEIKTAILEQIRGGGFSLNNLFGNSSASSPPIIKYR